MVELNLVEFPQWNGFVVIKDYFNCQFNLTIGS